MHDLRQFFLLLSLLLAIAIAPGGCSSTAPNPHPATAPTVYRLADEVKSMVHYLASDQLEGRGLETAGVHKAADYIETQFAKARLQPAPGLDGYRQSFPITLATRLGEKTRLEFNDRQLTLEKDYSPLGMTGEKQFSGPAVFVGYAITNPERGYDDFAGIDVKDKVAVALRFEPTDNEGKSQFADERYSPHATFTAKARNAAEHGAAALLIINSKKEGDKLMSLSNSAGEKSSIPVVHLSRSAGEKLLAEAGLPDSIADLDALQKEIDQSLKPRSFELAGVQFSGEIDVDHERKRFSNVIGFLPGKGRNRNEIIVVGAHYDHLGRGEAGSLAREKNEIHNGADDNASGTAAMLALAGELSRRGPLNRSVLFAAFVGEERGLLGSAHFVANPPVELDQVVAMVNLDMVGRVNNNVIMVGGNGTAASFDRIVAAADKASPLIVRTASTAVGGRGGIGPSDHTSFAMKRIPVLFLWTGNHRDYHRPSDDADKINFMGIALTVDFLHTLLERLDHWKREPYIDKFDAHGRGGVGGVKVRLGIMPDYNSDPAIPGVRVAGTMPDAPAEKAGLKEGDLIRFIDEHKIESLGDYMTALGHYKPGDVIRIVVDRDGQRLELSATLAEPKG